MKNDIYAENIIFSYDDKSEKLLNGIDLNIKKGEFTGILGPNGCGKSTLLKIILKYISPRTGIIRLQDKELKEYSQKELSEILSFVPQKSSLSMPMSVEEVVYMGRVPYIKNKWAGFDKEDDDKVSEILKKLNLENFRKRNIFSLSGGEFQRVLLARSLAQDTSIIMLDEPTSALDMNYALEIMKLVFNFVKTENMTAIMVMHDLNLASMYCDNLVFLKDGKIKYKGTPEELFRPEVFYEIYGFECEVAKHNGHYYVITKKI